MLNSAVNALSLSMPKVAIENEDKPKKSNDGSKFEESESSSGEEDKAMGKLKELKKHNTKEKSRLL